MATLWLHRETVGSEAIVPLREVRAEQVITVDGVPAVVLLPHEELSLRMMGARRSKGAAADAVCEQRR